MAKGTDFPAYFIVEALKDANYPRTRGLFRKHRYVDEVFAESTIIMVIESAAVFSSAIPHLAANLFDSVTSTDYPFNDINTDMASAIAKFEDIVSGIFDQQYGAATTGNKVDTLSDLLEYRPLLSGWGQVPWETFSDRDSDQSFLKHLEINNAIIGRFFEMLYIGLTRPAETQARNPRYVQQSQLAITALRNFTDTYGPLPDPSDSPDLVEHVRKFRESESPLWPPYRTVHIEDTASSL